MPTVLIYGLIDPRDRRIKYVGKTTDLARRFRCHLADASHSKRTHAIQKILRLGMRPVPILIELVDESVWQERERFWIDHLATHRLWNSTMGGDGVEMTSNVRRKLSRTMARKYAEPEQRQRLSAMASDPKRAEARREGVIRWVSKPHNLKMLRDRLAEMNSDPLQIKQRADRNRRNAKNPEWLASNAKALAAMRCNPISVEKHVRAVRENAGKPEWREACVRGIKEKRSGPDWRAKQTHGSRNRASNKLTAASVAEIKARLRSGARHQEIASEYGVSRPMIGCIANGRAWKDIEPGSVDAS